MRKNNFLCVSTLLLLCASVMFSCGPKAESDNGKQLVTDSTTVTAESTKTIIAKFHNLVLNSSGAILAFNDLDGNFYEFYETATPAKGIESFRQGIEPNVVDPKFDKILFEVTYNMQPKEFLNKSTGEYETREVQAMVEIKQIEMTEAELQKSKTVFTAKLLKSIVLSGTEPFWDIKFNETHAEYNDPSFNDTEKIYYRKHSNDNSKPKLSEVLKQVNHNTVEILCVIKNVPSKIVIKKQNCNDGMSDESYAYSVEFMRENMDTYKGCGREI